MTRKAKLGTQKRTVKAKTAKSKNGRTEQEVSGAAGLSSHDFSGQAVNSMNSPF